MGGLSYLEFMRDLSKRVDSEWDSVKADLHTIRASLLSRCVRAFGTPLHAHVHTHACVCACACAHLVLELCEEITNGMCRAVGKGA